MSNLERDPRETTCTAATATMVAPARIVLEPRLVPLGGVRAMHVRRTLPHRSLPSVGAWCFADDYGPDDVDAAGGMQVPPHPHTGLQTVTWLLEGEVLHQDSVGSETLVRPGELNLMTAGNGIAHAETTPQEHSARLRGVQLWVALPDQARHGGPHFEHHADLPRIEANGLRGTVLMGELAGHRSPADTYTPIVGADLELREGTDVEVPLDSSFEHAVLALSDGVEVDGSAVEAGSLVYLGLGRSDLRLGSAAPDARLMLLGGAPFEEELLMWWNFVGRSHEEIDQARSDWEESREDGGARFGRVSGYAGPALPAPALPSTRLKPRTRPAQSR